MTEEVVLETSVCHLKRFGDQKIFIFPNKKWFLSTCFRWLTMIQSDIRRSLFGLDHDLRSYRIPRPKKLVAEAVLCCLSGRWVWRPRWKNRTSMDRRHRKLTCLSPNVWGGERSRGSDVPWIGQPWEVTEVVECCKSRVTFFVLQPFWVLAFVFAGKRSRGHSVLIYLTLILLRELQCSSQTNSVMKEFVLAIWPGRRRRRSRSLTILKGLLHDFMNNISRTILGFVFCAFAWTISWSSKRKHHQLVTVFVSRQVANPTNIKGTFSDVFSFVHVCVLYSSLHLFLYHSLIFSLISRRLQQLEQSAT